MKKTTILFLLFVLLFVNTVQQPRAEVTCKATFVDIEPNSMLCYYANYLDYQRVIKGYSDLTYRKDNYVQRGEMAKFVANAFKIGIDMSTLKPEEMFKDIPKSHPFAEYIYALRRAGIIDGYSDNSYRSDVVVSHASVMKYIVNASIYSKKDLYTESSSLKFSDISDKHIFYSFVSKAYTATKDEPTSDQIISNNDKNLFFPDEPITREEMAKIISNAMIYGGFGTNSYLPKFSTLEKGITFDSIKAETGSKVYHYEDIGMTIINTTKDMNFVYMPQNALSLKDVAQLYDFRLVTNGSYFGGNYLSAEHAGYLNYYGLNLTPMKTDIDLKTLTHVVRYNKRTGKMEFVRVSDFIPTDTSTNVFEFQTGPIVLENWQHMADDIYNSKHGNMKRQRTLLAKTNDYDKYVITFRNPVSLNEAGHILINLSIFKGKDDLDIVNLDGGSSTSFYSEKYPNLNYNSDYKVPIQIGFK